MISILVHCMESQKLLDCTCLGPLQVKDWESNHFRICRNCMELDPHWYEMIKTMKGVFFKAGGVSLKSSAFAQRNQHDTVHVIHGGLQVKWMEDSWSFYLWTSRKDSRSRLEYNPPFNPQANTCHCHPLSPISILYLLFPSHACKIFPIILIVCVLCPGL